MARRWDDDSERYYIIMLWILFITVIAAIIIGGAAIIIGVWGLSGLWAFIAVMVILLAVMLWSDDND